MSALALKGPYWVTVRQYRRTLWLTGALVLLTLAVIGGLRIWDLQTPDVYLQDGYSAPSDENRGFRTLTLAMDYLGLGILFVPLLAGAFVAGPLVAREFESGTYKVSLTQSLSPATWLRAKLLTATAVALLATVALMGAFRIGWSRMAPSGYPSWDPHPYAATGIVHFAYVLAAVAVGALLGQLIRRTLVAMSATGLVMGVALLVMGAYRWSILPVKTVTAPAGPSLWAPGHGLVMETGLLTSSGTRFDRMICWEEASRTPGTDGGGDLWSKIEAQCLARNDVTGQYVDYHPESHFWSTQLIETGVLLALAVLAAFAAFRVLRARHP
ncbi:ABC transporter permease [Streptomyces exfoliatus]|uniref:ABC transporter permease n=1 Tax=Streptomyces exfoliatus TaxID=1905 RepID=UPI0004CA65B9|nr:ABC transporter permease [Streptomyces exfoliatus]